MTQAQTAQQAQTAVLEKAMDVQETQGQGLMRLLAGSEAVGQSSQVQDPMLGQNVDTYA